MRISYLLILGAFVLGLSGCVLRPKTDDTKFYSLNVAKVNDNSPDGRIGSGNLSIGIRSVKIPNYLDTPRILFRNDQNKIYYSERLRWAEPLKETFPRGLVVALQQDPSVKLAMHAPWDGRAVFDVEWRIEILRFESVGSGRYAEKNVTLEALCYAYKGNEANPVATYRYSWKKVVTESEVEYILHAQEDLILALAGKIATDSKALK